MTTKTILVSEVQCKTPWQTKLGSQNEAGSTAYSPSGNGNLLQNTPNGTTQTGAPHFVTGYLGGLGLTSFQSWAGTNASCGAQFGLHNNGANYLLADGHVKWLMGDAVSPGYNNLAGGSAAAQTSWQAEGTQNNTHVATFNTL